MRQYKVGLIRVLTTDDEELLQCHGRLIQQYFPMLEVQSRCIADQPEGIHDDETLALICNSLVTLLSLRTDALLGSMTSIFDFMLQMSQHKNSFVATQATG